MEMSNKIRVRMYNVGFGDCFLLMLPKKFTILVDAGFHAQGKGKFGANDLVKQIILDVKAFKGRARLDVIIATHRHQDHIFSFNSKDWDKIDVGEVWLPWVEDRDNKKAAGLWKKQKRFAKQLAAALPSFGLGTEDRASVDFMLWNAAAPTDGVEGVLGFEAWSNEGALDRLHDGFKSRDRVRPRFLPEKDTFPESFQADVIPDVRVHVLGPARDPELIEKLDPEGDDETYRALVLRAADASQPLAIGVLSPFGPAWEVGDDEAGPRLDANETERIDDLARNADAVFAAEKVDGMINSTSLVLVLEVGKARLLLAGDAEWGTWKRILENRDAKALVRGATFFKVGHHGSHNASSKTLIEKALPPAIPAMISTQEGPGSYRNHIPLPALLEAMRRRGMQFVRSDTSEGALPDNFMQDPEKKWIDLELAC